MLVHASRLLSCWVDGIKSETDHGFVQSTAGQAPYIEIEVVARLKALLLAPYSQAVPKVVAAYDRLTASLQENYLQCIGCDDPSNRCTKFRMMRFRISVDGYWLKKGHQNLGDSYVSDERETVVTGMLNRLLIVSWFVGRGHRLGQLLMVG